MYIRTTMNEKSKIRTALGLTIGVFLAAMEGTVVATAMPDVIRDLGGEHLYALPFSMYLLTMTISSPLWGKLSDIYGRKHIYIIGVVIFLISSAGCGMSQSMEFLIAMRVLQGLGAGCITPLTFTINADMFEVRRRAKVQGYMSAVWGFSGLVGPLLGGFMVDWLSWRYVFFLNIPFGLIALTVVAYHYRDRVEKSALHLDWPGTILFTAGAALLIYGLEEMKWWLIGISLISLLISWRFESNHPHPLLPVKSLHLKVPRTAMFQNLMAGMAYFGILAFLPLYVQEVEGKGATTAGLVLTPMVVGWTLTNIIGGRLLARLSLFTLIRIGFGLLVIGFLAFTLFYKSNIFYLSGAGLLVGAGMGFSMLGTLLAAQEHSPKHELGSSTSSVMFARTIGGSIGVSVLSAIISEQLNASISLLQSAFWWAYMVCLAFAIIAFLTSWSISQKSLK
ncbi:MFS transporter [Membranicola marinus]|uniref:MFS transporter n=1 Tax=Membranihabitans marinus TaxID=1227546 RepID=A0A953I154_9BACT|nr:MDR family MFS transporter [Membranihabitans marinus]MBY5959372.1 MFS transporter [Membranihabitans marinus]